MLRERVLGESLREAVLPEELRELPPELGKVGLLAHAIAKAKCAGMRVDCAFADGGFGTRSAITRCASTTSNAR
jgi:hypothetical protein